MTLFVNAALLFAVQPMFSKMVLPMLGGTPSVWNTCMLFFQTALLGGYLYAHVTTRWLDVRKQSVLQLALFALTFLTLPVAVASGWRPTGSEMPVWWLAALLAVSLGAPFFMLSTGAPLLQRWFSESGHPVGGESVLPVRREQPRKHGGAARVSGRHRADAASRATEPPLDRGLRGARGADRDLRVRRATSARAWRGGRGRHDGARPVAADATAADMDAFNALTDDRRERRRRTAHGMASRALGAAVVRAVEHAARRHDVPRDRRRVDPAALDRSARDLPADVRDRVRAEGRDLPPRVRACGCSRRSC